MADAPARFSALKESIRELADLAGPEHRERASTLADSLVDELEGLLGEMPSALKPARQRPKAPRDEVERCPVCTLRSYHYQRGTIRESEHGGFEAFYRCGSCAHEGWKEIQ